MRRGDFFYFEFRRPEPEDFGLFGLVVRFVINIAALWISQWIIPGFDIHGSSALIFGAIIFGIVNALIRPILRMVTCVFTLLTLGLFTLIINTAMLALTAWIAGLFELEFEVEGFLAAFFGALIISVVSTVLSRWAGENLLRPSRRPPDW